MKEESTGITLTDRKQKNPIASTELAVDLDKQEISYAKFLDQVEMMYYWQLPYQFTGSKVNFLHIIEFYYLCNMPDITAAIIIFNFSSMTHCIRCYV